VRYLNFMSRRVELQWGVADTMLVKLR